ncbi:MAG: CHAT domain-containing protein, partial [Blastocatellia bacterium]
MTAGELESERKLNSQLVSLNSQVMKERLRDSPDQNRLADLSVGLSKARSNYDTFRSNLYVTHPALEAQRGEFKPISLAECGSLINDRGTALLEFLVSDERVDLFVLTRKGTARSVPDLKIYTISIKKDALREIVEKFREHLAKRDLDYSAEAAKLYDLLLKPAASELAGKSNLVIVPDGVLWELPFQVMQPSRAHFLVQDYSISYAPSLTALREMSKPRSKTVSTAIKLSLLAFGNSVVRKERSAQIKEVFMDADLQPLPEAEDQVKTIGRIYGAGRSEVYVGEEATEDRLKAKAGSCRILHIATHGIIDNTNPMYSQIVLSQAQGSSDDGLLEAWEIANMDINADLVVLSACDTAGGRVEEGEGIIGLSWAFFIAGCPSTVVSQWSVEAGSTGELMVEFHRNLLAGLGKAEALRQAELKLLKSADHSHPFYWA